MTPAKMFDGDLWMLASDAVKMAENAYKKGQTDEREACAKVCDEYSVTENIKEFDRGWISCAKNMVATIRARTKGETNT
jgi:hypothetical protein